MNISYKESRRKKEEESNQKKDVLIRWVAVVGLIKGLELLLVLRLLKIFRRAHCECHHPGNVGIR